MLNSFIIILLINSLVTIGLILNQNESAKDVSSNMNSELSNPLQNLTWICVSFEFVLLLLKSKINDF